MADWKQEKQNRIFLAGQQQRRASDPEKSVWVEASAGTGKTKVLSDRVLRQLLSGVAPGRILCLTYTKAAAVEMNSRIADRLSRWAVIGNDELEAELEQLLGSLPESSRKKTTAQARKLFAVLLDTPGGMKIQTIHSFCQEILKRFPLEAKVSPYFEVMDDRAAAEALDSVKTALLNQIERDPGCRTAAAMAFLTAEMSEFTFPKLMNSLTENRNKILRMLEQKGGLDNLLAQTAKNLGVNEDDTPQKLKDAFFENVPEKELKLLTDAMAGGSAADAGKAESLKAALSVRDYEAYRKIFLTEKNEVRKSVATQGALKNYPDGQRLADEEAGRILSADKKIAAAGLLASTRAVLYLADELLRGYRDYKELHAKMDYEDLIVQTRKLLENPGVSDWVLFKLDGGIDNVLIDEAQDTSPDQWAIVRAITEEFFYGEGAKSFQNTVFAVGDRKQSIYSFQGADPQEFDRMRRHFAAKKTVQRDFAEVNLDVSFRSTAAILDVVNCIFAEGRPKQGVVSEGQSVVHIPSRIGEGGRVELWPLVEAEKDENPDIWLPPVERVNAESTSARLARQIAEYIRQKVEGGEILASKNRPLHYRDFMVLVQRRNSFVEELVRACKNAGVNVAGVDKIRLLEQIAVEDLVSIGKFVLLPEDDLTLAEILKSPLWGLTDDDLFELCRNRQGKTLWSRLGENAKYAGVYTELQSLLNMADYARPFEFYSHILNTLKGRQKFVARIGYEAEDGIDEFVNLCLDFEKEHIPSMQLFMAWISKDEVEIKRELEQSEADAVRIMTVHGSKGLQAPVVILPDTVRIKAVRNEAGLLCDENCLYYPLKSADYEDCCRKIKETEKELSLEEYHRLLYVALTRAEERLCICGYKMSAEPSPECWYELCRKALSRIAEEKEDGTLVYEVAQEAETKPREEEQRQVGENLQFPEWMRSNAPKEGPLARPLTPSKLDEAEDDTMASPLKAAAKDYYRRGRLIHKLLQLLPEVSSVRRRQATEEFLRQNGEGFTSSQKQRIVQEVMDLVENPEFGVLFGANSRAEVPLMGLSDGRIISGQIDRLVVEEDRVLIVDFKTNRPAATSAADVPPAYLKQMEAYEALVRQIYPGRRIELYILWTDTARMMKLN